MRHRHSGRQFNRTSSHRQAMMRNMAVSLLRHESIRTTVSKAKELRRVVEPLITLAKEDGVANRRQAFDRLRDGEIVGKLFADIGPRFRGRPGGYTRILKLGYRPGDAAEMAMIQFVEQASSETAPAEEKPTRKRRKKRKTAAKKAEASEKTAKGEAKSAAKKKTKKKTKKRASKKAAK